MKLSVILLLMIAVLSQGCSTNIPKGSEATCINTNYKSYIQAICNSEYVKMGNRIEGKASSVSFRVEPAGTLLSKTQFENDKARQKAESKSDDLFPMLLSLGNDFPDIGLRATCNVWTDGEGITFTTADGAFDVQARLLFEEGRTPIDLKQLARNICKQYDNRKPVPSDPKPSPIDPFAPAN